jgi:hypothetical protein
MQPDAPAHRTPCIWVFLAWLIVCIPAGWGITQTVLHSMDLFRSPTATTAAPTSQPTNLR